MLFEPTAAAPFPVRLEADYPDSLSRPSTLFRIVLAVPLLIFVALVTGGVFWTDLRAASGFMSWSEKYCASMLSA